MTATTSASDEQDERSNKIHLVNAYTNTSVPSTIEYFQMEAEEVHAMLQEAHGLIVGMLESRGVSYDELGPALTPRSNRHEVAYIFNSRAIESGNYGYEISRVWIPALKAVGPNKTAVRHGDIIGAPSPMIWRQLEEGLVGPADFPRLDASLYYVVYLNNLSATQLRALDSYLRLGSPAYLGYVDCSGWTPLKASLPLPQVALRLRSMILTNTDDGGTPNQVGYPFEDYGFKVVGVDDIYTPIFLESRIDMGVAAWGETDSTINLNALAPTGGPISSLKLEIDARRFKYLTNEEPGAAGHGTSLRRAGLLGLDRATLEAAIQTEVRKNFVFNLRFVAGSREVEGLRVPDAALDALMFTVQVEFPDQDGEARRYQVGVKYRPSDHSGEVVTMFG
jgi:hypothetical protein